MIRTSPGYIATDRLTVVIDEPENDSGFCMLKLQQGPLEKGRLREITFSPDDVPYLIAALTRAVRHSTLVDAYRVGHKDGIDAIKPDLYKALDRYYGTEEGKKAWPEDLAKYEKKKQ